MKPTKALHDLGQSLWIDDITRDNAGSAQESAAVSQQFATQAEDLSGLVSTLESILSSGRG